MGVMALAEGGTSASAAFGEIMTMAGQAMTFITGNSFLVICFASCIVPIAFKVIKKARKSVGA